MTVDQIIVGKKVVQRIGDRVLVRTITNSITPKHDEVSIQTIENNITRFEFLENQKGYSIELTDDCVKKLTVGRWLFPSNDHLKLMHEVLGFWSLDGDASVVTDDEFVFEYDQIIPSSVIESALKRISPKV